MSRLLRLSVIAAVLLAAFALAACGSKKTRLVPQLASEGTPPAQTQPATAVSLDDTLSELDALETPDDVDEALFAELKDALRDALLTQKGRSGGLQATTPLIARPGDRASSVVPTAARFACAPPTGEANRVNDLAILDNGDGTFTLTWHYKNLGDYDQDGTVGISDITPIAMHFGEEVPADDINRNSIQAVIDGSGNGVVDIADIVVLAQRLATQVAGYAVEGSQAIDGAFSFIQAIGLDAGATDGRLLITHTVSQVGFKCVRVSPTDASGAAGDPSNAVFMPATGRGDWYMFGRDAQHSHTSPYIGPRRNPVVKWKLDTGGSLSLHSDEYPCPVIAADGTVYLMGDGRMLYAVNPDGTVKWQSETRANRTSNPALGIDGTVYVAGSMLQAFSPSGEVVWEYDLNPFQHFWSKSSPLIGTDGTIYVGTISFFDLGPGDFTLDEFLYAVNPDGSTKWMAQDIGGLDWAAPAMSSDGTIYSVSQQNLCAVTPRGQLLWQYESPLYRFSPTLDGQGNIYLRNSSNHIMVFNPNGVLVLNVDMSGSYATWSLPIVGADGTICLGNNDACFYAFNPDGSVKWKYETSYDVESTAVLDAEGRIYFGCDGGFLYCLNTDGELVWRLDVGSSVRSALAMAADGTLHFVTYDGYLYAVAEDPGGEPPEAVMSVSPMWGRAPLEVSFGLSLSNDPDGEIVLYEWDFDGDGKYERSSETELTTSHTFAENGQHTVSLRVTDEQGLTDTASRTIIVRDDDARGDWWMFGREPRHTRRSPFVGPHTATVKWSRQLGLGASNARVSSPSIAADGTIYIGNLYNALYALSPDGEIKWEFETDGPVMPTPAVAPSGVVYFGSHDGYFYAINPDGTLNWKRRLGYIIRSSPAVGVDGTVYVGCCDTYVYALQPDGNVKWSFKTGEWIASSPAIDEDGTVMVASYDGYLYALRKNGELDWCSRIYRYMPTSPCISADDDVYINGRYKLFSLYGSGYVSWIYPLESSAAWKSDPALSSDGSINMLQRTSNGSNLLRLDPGGDVVGEYSLGEGVFLDSYNPSPAIGADGIVYIGHWLGVLAMTPDGVVIWNYGSRKAITDPVLANDGTLYVGCQDGYLYAFADEVGTQ